MNLVSAPGCTSFLPSSSGSSDADSPKMICVTIPPAPAKVVKVTAEDPYDLTGIAKEGVLTWINYTADDLEKELPIVTKRFGFNANLVKKLMAESYGGYEDIDTEMGIVTPAVRIRELEVDIRPVYIFMNAQLILTVHDRNVTRMVSFSRYVDVWLSKLPSTMPPVDKMTMILARLIEVVNERNFEQLRLIDDKADDISEALLDPTIHFMETGKYVYDVKHTLILYLNALWRSLDLLNKLRYGDAELISDHPKVLQRINVMVTNVTKHISLTEHTSTVLVSGTTVLQTLHNNQLLIINNRLLLAMTWMTIIGTAVLVPNTMATIFGYIYTVPPEHLLWSLATIIISTVVSTIFAYRWVMKRMDPIDRPVESMAGIN